MTGPRENLRIANLRARLDCTACGRHLRYRDVGVHERCPRCRGSETNFAKQFKYVVDHKDMSPLSIAARLKINIDRVYGLRNRARRAGHSFPPRRPPRPPHRESQKWSRIEDAMRVACARCGLRGPHECVHSIYAFAQHRRAVD